MVRSDTASLADVDAVGHARRREAGDFVFINAGFAKLIPLEQATEDVYDQTFGVNTKAAYFTVKRLPPQAVPDNRMGPGSSQWTTRNSWGTEIMLKTE